MLMLALPVTNWGNWFIGLMVVLIAAVAILNILISWDDAPLTIVGMKTNTADTAADKNVKKPADPRPSEMEMNPKGGSQLKDVQVANNNAAPSQIQFAIDDGDGMNDVEL